MSDQTIINWQEWSGHASLHSRKYICGYCSQLVASHVGYFPNHAPPGDPTIYICTNCGLPSFFFGTDQTPGASFGREIKGVPENIAAVYKEIRDTARDGSYTGSLLLGRKLIVHMAVEAKAEEGKSFAQYVDYLLTKGYIPPNADKLLTYMRKLGNEKNHEITLGTSEEATRVVKFVEALLYFMYEINNEFNDDSQTAA